MVDLFRASPLGRKAVDFALTDTTGVVHRAADYLGRPLLLVFHRHLA